MAAFRAFATSAIEREVSARNGPFIVLHCQQDQTRPNGASCAKRLATKDFRKTCILEFLLVVLDRLSRAMQSPGTTIT
jgi:hypothetical protein